MTYSLAFAILWVVWMISWSVAAVWASRPQARPPERDERFYWLLTFAGAVLLFLNFRTGRLEMARTSPDWIEWTLSSRHSDWPSPGGHASTSARCGRAG